MLTPFQIIAVILTLSAAGGYLNHRFLRFPPTIGLMALAFLGSLAAIALSRLGLIDLRPVGLFVQQIDFSNVVLHGMLSFLLFAGALHINVEDLRSMKWSVAILATAGVAIATFIVGGSVWLAAGFLGLALPLIYALLFGALISPTDPIAILAILKDAGISRQLYTKIGSESLFNDGVGVVVFLTILEFVNGGGVPKASAVAILFLQQAGGGVILGLLFGWITYRFLKSIDNYKVEVLLTLALVRPVPTLENCAMGL